MTSTFADHYRAHVLPRLRQMTIEAADHWLAEEPTFSEIFDEIWHEAVRRGATRLPENLRDELHDWLMTLLAERIEAAEKLQDDADALVRSLLREPSRDVLRERIREFLSAG